MDARPEASSPASGVDPRAASPNAVPATSSAEDAVALPSLRQLMDDLQATLLALAALARSELRLSFALLLRAGVLAVIGLLLIGLAVVLGCALLVATCLALGLSWPASLAISLTLLLAAGAACWLRASRHLGDCGLPRTREQLSALWREHAP